MQNTRTTAPRALFVLYLLTLAWLVFFKFSYDLPGVLLHYQVRILNLIPFAQFSGSTFREMLDNAIVFVPFGLLLQINFKEVSIWRKLAVIFAASLGAEILQFAFAIGVSDVTDVIMNTAGGLVGLVIYAVARKVVVAEKLDRGIVIAGSVILALLLLVRIFVIRVRY